MRMRIGKGGALLMACLVIASVAFVGTAAFSQGGDGNTELMKKAWTMAMEKAKAAQTASTLQEARAHLTQVAACVDPVFARRLNPRINEELVCEKGMGGGMMKTGKAAGGMSMKMMPALEVTEAVTAWGIQNAKTVQQARVAALAVESMLDCYGKQAGCNVRF